MSADKKTEKRNLSILYGQGSLATIGWTLASPSVVLIYLAISLDVPVFLAGLLVTVRRAANLGAALFASEFAATRSRRKRDLATTDIVLAVCYLLAVAAVAYGTSLLVTIAFILVITCIGFTEEYQSLLNYDFMADVLPSKDRMRLMYTAMTIGGLGTIAFVWTVHLLMQDAPALSRHSTVVLIAIGCFCLSAGAMMLVRELASGSAVPTRQELPEPPAAPANALQKFKTNLVRLLGMPWFRKFMAMRLALQTIELSIPFFAILAALAHGGSHKGLTALVISSAAALVVAAPLWRAVSQFSNRLVMLLGAFLAAGSGFMLVFNHFYHFADTIYLHAVALFCVTVAVQGVQTARYLYYMDIAPKQYRVRGLAVSKSVVRVSGIAIATLMAALAHTQHVVWAIVVLACLNILAACIAFAIASQKSGLVARSPQN
jgi:hypothetical protein